MTDVWVWRRKGKTSLPAPSDISGKVESTTPPPPPRFNKGPAGGGGGVRPAGGAQARKPRRADPVSDYIFSTSFVFVMVLYMSRHCVRSVRLLLSHTRKELLSRK
jgi:hypothetical protein